MKPIQVCRSFMSVALEISKLWLLEALARRFKGVRAILSAPRGMIERGFPRL
jgi:hypothetical protein